MLSLLLLFVVTYVWWVHICLTWITGNSELTCLRSLSTWFPFNIIFHLGISSCRVYSNLRAMWKNYGHRLYQRRLLLSSPLLMVIWVRQRSFLKVSWAVGIFLTQVIPKGIASRGAQGRSHIQSPTCPPWCQCDHSKTQNPPPPLPCLAACHFPPSPSFLFMSMCCFTTYSHFVLSHALAVSFPLFLHNLLLLIP